MRLETGRIARQSNGSVLVTYGETTIHAAVNAAKEAREDIDFFHCKLSIEKNITLGEKYLADFLKERLDRENMRF